MIAKQVLTLLASLKVGLMKELVQLRNFRAQVIGVAAEVWAVGLTRKAVDELSCRRKTE